MTAVQPHTTTTLLCWGSTCERLEALPGAGRKYRWYPIPVAAAYERTAGNARLSLQLAVAELKCGEAMSCRVVGKWEQGGGQQATAQLFDWTSVGCWFQYWHFTSGCPARPACSFLVPPASLPPILSPALPQPPLRRVPASCACGRSLCAGPAGAAAMDACCC
jgi:hypothetical protein